MKLGHVSAIVVSGALWFFVGCMLLFKGLFLIVQSLALYSLSGQTSLPLLNTTIKYLSNPQTAAAYLVAISVVVGYLKAKFVLSKTAKRNVTRLLSMPSPLHLKDLFTVSYMILIAFMAGLGMTLRFIPIYPDVKAVIDIAVGFALIYGFILYLKYAAALKASKVKKK